MAMEIGCFDLGVYCDFKARAESLEDLVQIVTVHARERHDLEELSADMVQMIGERARDIPNLGESPTTLQIKKVGGRQSLDDLAVPIHVGVGLRRLCESYRRSRESGDPPTRGGLVSLFVGESGTGRRAAAEAVANELGLDLYEIDLTGVTRKSVGETEKSLERVLDDAEGTGAAVLFFDEADALFAQRTEVEDSQEPYPTVNLNGLVKRLEAYEGLTILTPSPGQNIDGDVLRRMRFIVNFSFP